MRLTFTTFMAIVFFSIDLPGQTIYTIKAHYESLNVSPYTQFKLHDTVALEFTHQIGEMDLYAVKYTYPGSFTATPIVIDKKISSDYRVVLPIEESGCYQFRIVPGPKLRYVHGELAVKTGPKRTCTINLDTGYMATGKEMFFDQELIPEMSTVKEIDKKAKQVHSNGTMYVEIGFDARKGDSYKVELKTGPENPRINLLIKREDEPYDTIVYRTYQNEHKIAFEVLENGRYVIQYWGREIFERMDEVSVSQIR